VVRKKIRTASKNRTSTRKSAERTIATVRQYYAEGDSLQSIQGGPK